MNQRTSRWRRHRPRSLPAERRTRSSPGWPCPSLQQWSETSHAETWAPDIIKTGQHQSSDCWRAWHVSQASSGRWRHWSRFTSHLMDLGCHVTVDNLHVSLSHPHQYFHHGLRLLSAEACRCKTFEENLHVGWRNENLVRRERSKPFSSKSRTTACVSNNLLPPSGVGGLAAASYWKSLVEVLRSEIKR